MKKFFWRQNVQVANLLAQNPKMSPKIVTIAV